jgi:protein TonB
MPGFVEMPHSLVPSFPRLAAGSHTSRLAEPEPMPVTAALSVSGAVLPPSRPLSVVVAGPARVLRDPAAEGGGVRSKVGPGDNPRPEYPRAAREAGWEGTVVLQVEVLPDGLAGTVWVYETSGHALLDEAARRAVQDWRFVPAMDGNFPVRTVVHLPIRFDLRAQN